MMKKIKMGMIGGGTGAFIGDAHRRAARICNDYDLVGGVFSSNPERNRESAAREGIAPDRCYDSVDAMIAGELAKPEDERIRLVSIVTPNSLHFSQAKAFLSNGFHLVC
ncbi:MAG TPA: Gfo/Idh/MocA family oxidoreductase, partial [Bacteroidales bacterium]|nr:Gfo/Idh/MocA family oxidoreductase [Bacteroidales bacterium]